MNGNGIQVSLPPSPRLEKLRRQMAATKRERDEAATDWGRLDIQRRQADSAAQRQALQTAADTAYAGQQAAERCFSDLSNELAAREHDVAHLVYERDQLADELERSPVSDAPVASFTIRNAGQPEARQREIVEDELLRVTHKLALFTDSEEIMKQAVGLDQRIKDSRPYITLTRNYVVRRSDNRILSEQQFNEEAVTEADKKGINAYPRGTKIERSAAAALGLIEMEAQP
jgi:hypothetical protein